MKATEKPLLQFMEGSEKCFIIPVYQRNYDWAISHCGRLFDDLLDIIKNKFRKHFFGSLVSIYEDGQEYLIIDGQQRLTTISLLLIALHDFIEEKNINVKEAIPAKIKEEYLVRRWHVGEKRIKLKPIKNDKEAFNRLFELGCEHIEDSNITRNYTYLKNRIENMKCSPDELYQAIQKLIIVDIELKTKEDDPQLIFESLNSTGLDLSQADLVRNFILMRESPDIQNSYYEDYWNKIEQNTNYHVDSFIRDYLTMDTNIIPKKSNIYTDFKKYVELLRQNEDFNIEILLKKLLQYSKYYNIILTRRSKNSEISELLKEISRLDITVCYPFLLEVFNLEYENILTEKQVTEILKTIISFSFRRIVCDLATNALNKIFMSLGKEIRKNSNYKENYVEILNYILVNKKLTQRFPDDAEFIEKLNSKDIYNMNSKNKIHLLSELENFDNRERVDVENLLAEKVLTIEHIMPRTLTPKWKELLGEKAEETYNKYINSIGNLTLTAYNSKYQNSIFNDKKTMEKGFNESRLYLNSFLQTVDNWTQTEITQRAKLLTDKALKIWKYPTTDFVPDGEIVNSYTLQEDFEATNMKIYQFDFWEQSYKVDSWKNFAEKLLAILFELDSSIINRFASNENYNKLYNTPDKLRNAAKIKENLYFETNLSANAFVNTIREIVQEYNSMGIELDEIVIYLKEREK